MKPVNSSWGVCTSDLPDSSTWAPSTGPPRMTAPLSFETHHPSHLRQIWFCSNAVSSPPPITCETFTTQSQIHTPLSLSSSQKTGLTSLNRNRLSCAKPSGFTYMHMHAYENFPLWRAQLRGDGKLVFHLSAGQDVLTCSGNAAHIIKDELHLSSVTSTASHMGHGKPPWIPIEPNRFRPRWKANHWNICCINHWWYRDASVRDSCRIHKDICVGMCKTFEKLSNLWISLSTSGLKEGWYN